MRKTPLLLAVATCIVVLAASAPAFAWQAAVLAIKLEAPGKKPVAGATVELSCMESSKVTKMTSDKSGQAIKVGVRPGMYSAMILCDGFAPLKISVSEVKNIDRLQLTFPMNPLH